MGGKNLTYIHACIQQRKDTLDHKSQTVAPQRGVRPVQELAGLSGTFCPVAVQFNFLHPHSTDRDEWAKMMRGEQNREGQTEK